LGKNIAVIPLIDLSENPRPPLVSLDKARRQLELAQALGYGTKKDFDKMYQQLTEVEEKTADNKFGSGFFAKIKVSIADFMKTSQPSKP
jgi:hypothetical protein